MKLYGLVGFPLGHSFSKIYFTEKFSLERIDARYNLYELKDIHEFTSLKITKDLCGLNVTIPYKQQIIPFLNEMDETAAEIGAVNVIKFIRNGHDLILKGYNSDVIGFRKSIQPHLKHNHTKALILGTGGASKAIEYALRKMGLEVKLVSRNSVQNQFSYNDLNKEILSEYTVLVNASPAGMYPHVDECPDIPYEALTSGHLLFDAVYNPEETLFLRKGKEKGAVTLNGKEMLIGQAEAAWEIWEAP